MGKGIEMQCLLSSFCYHSGDYLRGRVYVTTKNPVELTNVKLRLFGLQRLTKLRDDGSHLDHLGSLLLDDAVELETHGAAVVDFERGVQYSFEYRLHPLLPASVGARLRRSSLRYWAQVEATVSRSAKLFRSPELPFELRERARVEDFDWQFLLPLSVSKVVELPCHNPLQRMICCRVTLECPRAVFRPGDRVDVSLTIENLDAKACIGGSVKLSMVAVEKVLFGHEVVRELHCLAKDSMKSSKVGPGSSQRFPSSLTVPKDVLATTLPREGRKINVWYRLEAAVHSLVICQDILVLHDLPRTRATLL